MIYNCCFYKKSFFPAFMAQRMGFQKLFTGTTPSCTISSLFTVQLSIRHQIRTSRMFARNIRFSGMSTISFSINKVMKRPSRMTPQDLCWFFTGYILSYWFIAVSNIILKSFNTIPILATAILAISLINTFIKKCSYKTTPSNLLYGAIVNRSGFTSYAMIKSLSASYFLHATGNLFFFVLICSSNNVTICLTLK